MTIINYKNKIVNRVENLMLVVSNFLVTGTKQICWQNLQKYESTRHLTVVALWTIGHQIQPHGESHHKSYDITRCLQLPLQPRRRNLNSTWTRKRLHDGKFAVIKYNITVINRILSFTKRTGEFPCLVPKLTDRDRRCIHPAALGRLFRSTNYFI